MNKKVFKSLVVLMGFSILGIIAVQLVWMNNALRIRNELFDRSVMEALNNTAKQLEMIHDLDIISDLKINDSLHWETNKNILPVNDSIVDSCILITKRPTKPGVVNIVKKVDKPQGETKIEIQIDSDDKLKNRYSYQYNINSSPKHKIIDNEFSDDDIIIIKKDNFPKGMDSIYQEKQILIDSLVTQLDTFKILAPDINKRLKTKAIQLNITAGKAVQEIRTWGIRKIDTRILRKTLGKELESKQIPIAFEMGVLKDSSIIHKEEKTDSILLSHSKYNVKLYPNDIFQKNLHLAIYFPEQDSFIFHSINWLLIISFLFSMFILLTFTLSVFYILKQKKISEMKSDFINNMTHEFKTPIATIAVATDSILNDKVIEDPERIRYFTGMIKKENKRMNQQVEDILTIARLDNKEFEFRWEVTDINGLIDDAIQGIILQIEKRDGKIDTQLNATNPVITTDKIHCTNIIYNLLDNANKYSPNSPEILITTRNTAKGVIVSVSDKGIGMSKSVQSKIFERFYRQTSGNIHNVKGFGLGLSYVKAVVDANKGSISVQSEPGKGSKFELFIPFTRVSN